MTLGKLGNPEGEVILTRGAKKHNVIQMIPTLASCSFDEIVDAKQGDQAQWLQLYVNKDRAITERIIKHAEKRGCKGLFITVDAPQVRTFLTCMVLIMSHKIRFGSRRSLLPQDVSYSSISCTK